MPWFALAPPASSAATTSVCPFSAAMKSGVTPLVRAEEKGGAPSKEGHESHKQRESNEKGGRLERKEKEDNMRAPASLSLPREFGRFSLNFGRKKSTSF